jgi:hypothetical protein
LGGIQAYFSQLMLTARSPYVTRGGEQLPAWGGLKFSQPAPVNRSFSHNGAIVVTTTIVTQERWCAALAFLMAKKLTSTTLPYAEQRQLGGYREGLFFPGMSQGEATRVLRGIGWRMPDEL